MRILVYPHDLGVGGSQLNAIELAGAVARLGHHVAVFGAPGPLTQRIDELGLDFIASPTPRRRPSPAVLRSLTAAVRTHGFDVLHGYEWPPALESWLVARRLGSRTVSTATVMSMAVADFLPRTVPLLVGTEQIAAVERAAGRDQVAVLEPPVDLALNNPEQCGDLGGFLARWSIDKSALTIVMVTRLARELKAEGILTAIDAVGGLAESGRRAQLVIVGDGPAHDEVRERAAAVNSRCGTGTVVLTGELLDPRPAYAAADIVLGMGGSALRAMAFAKPLIVQGERGFWRPLTPATAAGFRWTGWYGIGLDPAAGRSALLDALTPLLDSPALRAERGAFSLEAVQDFSLEHAAHLQLHQYELALATTAGSGRSAIDTCRTSIRYGRYFIRQRVQRLRRAAASDDFNSAPALAADQLRVPRS